MTRVLLLGATGFIGAHVHRALCSHHLVEDVRSIGRQQLDLTSADVDDVRDVVQTVRPDVVVNCTGGLDGTVTDLIRWQTVTTALLLDALSDSGIRLVRLGSAGEYGPIEQGTSVLETASPAPISPYGISHLAATMLIDQARAGSRVLGVTLRVFNPIGRGSGTGSLLARAAAEFTGSDGAPVTFGSLDPFRDFVDARDVADAVVAVTTAATVRHSVYNIGTGRAVQIRDAVQRLAQMVGHSGPILESSGGAARSAGIGWTQADIGRMRTDFDWEPTRTLEDSLVDIVAGVHEPAAQGFR